MTEKLTKREYLGEGYHHLFQNNKTGEQIYVPCTKEEYFELGEKDIQPVLKGHIWVNSQGGTYLVDTPDGRLGINEYCETGKETVVRLDHVNPLEAWKILPKGSVENDVMKETP